MYIKLISKLKKDYNATAIFEDGKVTVLAGSKLSNIISTGLPQKGIILKMRNDDSLIKNDILIKDCIFNSLSTAAQFVTGTITNGKLRWCVEDGRTLKKYFDDKNHKQMESSIWHD